MAVIKSEADKVGKKDGVIKIAKCDEPVSYKVGKYKESDEIGEGNGIHKCGKEIMKTSVREYQSGRVFHIHLLMWNK